MLIGNEELHQIMEIKMKKRKESPAKTLPTKEGDSSPLKAVA